MKYLFHKKLLTIFSAFLMLTFLSPLAQAQGKKDLNKKLENIDGKVTKISIQTDKGTVNFTGKEAEEILKKLKKKERKFVFTVSDDSFSDGDHDMVFFSDDDNIFEIEPGKDGITETIKVKDVDGEKEVTIKTTKDGKTTVKELTGKEAQKYLDEHKVNSKTLSWVIKDGKKVRMKRFTDDDEWIDKNGKDVIIIKDRMKNHFKRKGNVEKEIEVNVNDGVKEITVTTTKDGKKTIKVYKGKEAEEFLENLDDDNDINIDIDGKDHHMKKIIIIEKKKKTDKDK